MKIDNYEDTEEERRQKAPLLCSSCKKLIRKKYRGSWGEYIVKVDKNLIIHKTENNDYDWSRGAYPQWSPKRYEYDVVTTEYKKKNIPVKQSFVCCDRLLCMLARGEFSAKNYIKEFENKLDNCLRRHFEL